MSIKYYY